MKGLGQNAAESSGTRLIKGIAVLGAAAVISKLLGTLQKIPLQNLAGDEAFGIYSAVYPFYVLILFLATAGFPTAVSKLVSEQTAAGQWLEARRIYRMSSVILTFTGIAAFLFMFFGSGMIAGWIGSSQAEQSLRSVSFALLIVPFMAASRGYFQGMQNMIPTAVSQVTEQTVRVTVMIVLLVVLTQAEASSGMIAAGATFGSAAGAAAGLAVMMVYDWRERAKMKHRLRSEQSAGDGWTLMRRIVRHALPVALGAIAVPIISMIDSFTLPRMLTTSHGLSENEAIHQFGIYARGLPLVQLVAMLFSSMGAALVPSLSSANMQGDLALVRRRTELSLRLTWMIGLAASAGLSAVSLPVNIMLYTDSSGTMTMMIMAWTGLFSCLNVVTAALLQGISLEKLPALHLLLAAAIKVALNVLLIPYFGIAGAAWAGVIAYAAASFLNLRALLAHTGLAWRLKDYLGRPLIAMTVMLAVITAVYGAFQLTALLFDADTTGRLWNTAQALIMIAAGAAAFAAAALRSGALREEELKLAPGLYRRIAPLLRKWRIMRSDRP